MVNIAAQELIGTHIHDVAVVAISIYKSREAVQVQRCRLSFVTIVIEVGVIGGDGIVIAGVDTRRAGLTDEDCRRPCRESISSVSIHKTRVGVDVASSRRYSMRVLVKNTDLRRSQGPMINT